MKLKLLTFLGAALLLTQKTDAQQLKPRVVVLTDVSTWETDDSESLVRLLAHADLLEIEGLVFTTGWNLDTTRDDFLGLIRDAINAYEKDLPNLRKRSLAKAVITNNDRQQVGYWPDADYLRSRSVTGSKQRGSAKLGEGNDSEGSDLIIQLVDENDKRPVWVLAWGGGNTLAQALWRVQNSRNERQVEKFLKKVRLFTITDQDKDPREPFEAGSHQWMREQFGQALFFIWDESAWKKHNATGKRNWPQYETHIQGHGHMGNVYPKYKYGVEGDTPSFLYVLPNGLNTPEHPSYGSWGGYFEWTRSADDKTFAYTNHEGTEAHEISGKYEDYFYPATFNNFAARMDWAAYGKGNRNPQIAINGKDGMNVIHLRTRQGKSVKLDASESSDPDGDDLQYNWWILPEAGTYGGEVALTGKHTSQVNVQIPADAAGQSIHLICEVTDNGEHPLTSYRRIIFYPKK